MQRKESPKGLRAHIVTHNFRFVHQSVVFRWCVVAKVREETSQNRSRARASAKGATDVISACNKRAELRKRNVE